MTNFLVDSNNPTGYTQVVEERDSSNALTRSYTLGHDVISQWDKPADPNAPNVPTYLLTDGHGSTRLLVTAAGTVAERYLYDAYGNMLSGTGYEGLKSSEQASTRLLYSGEWTEVVTGWQYLRARFYDPRTGRMHTVDPAVGNNTDPQSLHKYTYVHGDPVNAIDPSGEESITSTLQVIATRSALALLDVARGGDIGVRPCVRCWVALDEPGHPASLFFLMGDDHAATPSNSVGRCQLQCCHSR